MPAAPVLGQATSVAAAVAINACRVEIDVQDASPDAPGLPACEQTWRDIRLIMYKDWTGSLESLGAKDARSWEFRCARDRAGYDECWLQSSNIRISRATGSGYRLSWGRPGYPQTDSVIHLDGSVYYRVREEAGLAGPHSAAAISQMKTSMAADLEWHDWTTNSVHKDRIDLAGFRNIIFVFEAIHDGWRRRQPAGQEIAHVAK